MEVEMAAAESVSGDQSPYLHEETPHDGHTHTGTDSTKESTKDSEDQSSSQPQNADDTVYPHGLRLISTLTALILSVFLVSLDRTIIATAIPRITSEFNSLSQVGWYASAFFLTLASFQSTWGKCYKYFPMKLIFLLSIFLFELGSLVSGVAPNSTALIVGRAISGCGGAGIIAGAYILIALSGPPKKRPLYTGLIGAVYGIASVVGPLLGGVLTENVSWRWVFYLNLPIGGVSAGIILFTLEVPKSVQAEEVGWKEKILQMDLLGTFIIMGAVTCFLLALQWAGVTKSWSDKDVVGTLVGFVVLFVIFCVLEWYLGERALLQGRLLKKRIIIVSSVYGTFLGGAFFSLVYYLPIYFQSISGVSPLASGTRNLGLIILISLFSIISGAAITVFGHYVPWMIGGSVLAAIGSGLLYTLGIGSTSSHWIGYQIVAGMGFGGGFQVPVIATRKLMGRENFLIGAVSEANRSSKMP
jgi:EmrB/QacA subfamily drug resistance transporter